MGSHQPRDQTCVSCTGKRIPYHWATREALHVYCLWPSPQYHVVGSGGKRRLGRWSHCAQDHSDLWGQNLALAQSAACTQARGGAGDPGPGFLPPQPPPHRPWGAARVRGNGAEQDVALDPSPALPLPTLSSCLDGRRKGRPHLAWGLGGPPASNTQTENQLCRLIQSFNQQWAPAVCKLYHWDDHMGLPRWGTQHTQRSGERKNEAKRWVGLLHAGQWWASNFKFFFFFFLAVLGFVAVPWLFLVASSWGYSPVVVLRLLISVASLVVEHGL